jgi:plasmid stabilization system protein ParE
MAVEFHPAAEQELDAAAAVYEALQESLGQGLLDEVEAACVLISEYPAIGRRVDQFHRNVPLRRFPFMLFYRVDGALIRIIAVAHKRKRPGYWRLRK